MLAISLFRKNLIFSVCLLVSKVIVTYINIWNLQKWTDLQLSRRIVLKVIFQGQNDVKIWSWDMFPKVNFPKNPNIVLRNWSPPTDGLKWSETVSKLRWPEVWIQKCKIHGARRQFRDIRKAFSGVKFSAESDKNII